MVLTYNLTVDGPSIYQKSRDKDIFVRLAAIGHCYYIRTKQTTCGNLKNTKKSLTQGKIDSYA